MKKIKLKQWNIPGWVFLIFMSLYVEVLLHVWTAGELVPGRMAAVLVFGLAFGSVLSVPGLLLPPAWEKWLDVVLGVLLSVLMLMQFFINDAYSSFMPMISVVNTAEGVATGYMDVIIPLLLNNLWRIALVLLPVVLYAVFGKCGARNWKRAIAMLLAALTFYCAGIGVVTLVNLDTAQLSAAANFDGTVRSFGLSMGMLMDLSGGAVVGDRDGQFEEFTPIVIPQATQAPEVEPTESDESQPPMETEPPVVYNPHVLDLDFAALAQEETNKKIAPIHEYLATLTPAMENEYTGLLEGKNLILITAEAFSHKVIDPELTPTLYRMATEGIQFTEYYQPVWGCGTTGGEFTNLVGMVPYGGTATMMEVVEQDLFLTMGKQLQKLGYASAAFHNNDHTYYKRHKTHTELGYDTFFAWGNGMEELISNGWTRSDLEMFQVTLPDYLDKGPFSLYYMTLSGHSPYRASSNSMSKKNFEYVENLPYSSPVKAYLACNLELEHAMAYTIAALEEAGIADDTVIVIASDHYPYGLAPSETWGDKDYMKELYGTGWSKEYNRDRNALIIWSGCLEDKDIVVDTPVFSLDILPTLSNLFGLEYDSRLMVGRDVFSDAEPLVFWPLTYGWKTDKGYYDGKARKFTPAEGVEVEEGYVEAITAMVNNKTVFCRSVQKTNYFNVISALLNPEPEETVPPTTVPETTAPPETTVPATAAPEETVPATTAS